MPDPPAEPAREDLPALVAALRAANAWLREVIEAKDAQLAAGAALEAADARFAELSERVAELQRRLGKDSSTSSWPPSSDSPYKNKPRDQSLRQRSGRRRGKQPGAQSSTLRQVASTRLCDEQLAEISARYRARSPRASPATRESVALHLQADDPELTRRLLARTALEHRSDDTPEIIAQRLAIYHDVTSPVISW